MKNVLIGIFIISTLAFCKFEKQFGYSIVEKNENTLVLKNSKNENCILIVIKSKENITNKKFYDFIEKFMGEKDYEIVDSGNNYVFIESKGHIPMIIINNENSLLIIDAPNSKYLKNVHGYLQANDISTPKTNMIISTTALQMSLKEITEK
ncbi:MAG: hypothetical protein ACRC5S_03860 [Cetobacterium sp.]